MKKLFGIAAILLVFISCDQDPIVDRSRSKLPKRNYADIDLQKDCVEKLWYGQIYVEFSNLDRKQILNKLKVFNDSIFGAPRDTIYYKASGTPWGTSMSWVAHDLFVNYNDNHYGYLVFPPNGVSQDQIIQYGMGNVSSTIEDHHNLRYLYEFAICPREKLTSEYSEYGIGVRRALLTEEQADELSYENYKKVTHPSDKTTWIRYKVDKYLADVLITLNLQEQGEKPEYYLLPMRDTIRVYTVGGI